MNIASEKRSRNLIKGVWCLSMRVEGEPATSWAEQVSVVTGVRVAAKVAIHAVREGIVRIHTVAAIYIW